MWRMMLPLCSLLAVAPARAAGDDAGPSPAAATVALPKPDARGAVRVLPGVLSTRRNEYSLSLDAAERRLVFARSDADFAKARVWIAERGPSGWSLPRETSLGVAGFEDSDPWLTPDGRTLYFISNRPGGGRDAARKDYDVWRVAIDASGAFGTPERLGPEVNSERDELGPELHDGWLYFASTRPGGPAGCSIYRARQAENGTFGAAEALPKVVNAGRAQGDPTFSPKGDVMVFWRLREGTGDGDLYALRRQGAGWAREAVRLPEPFSSSGFDFTPSFTADGAALYFASDRRVDAAEKAGPGTGGLADLYVLPASELYRVLDQAASAQQTR